MTDKVPPKETPAVDDAMFKQVFGGMFDGMGKRVEKIVRGQKVYKGTPTFRVLLIDEADGHEIARLPRMTSVKINGYKKNAEGMPDVLTYALAMRIQELAALCHIEPMMLERWLQSHPDVVEMMQTLPRPEDTVEEKPLTE